jgi:hypothetical protein
MWNNWSFKVAYLVRRAGLAMFVWGSRFHREKENRLFRPSLLFSVFRIRRIISARFSRSLYSALTMA